MVMYVLLHFFFFKSNLPVSLESLERIFKYVCLQSKKQCNYVKYLVETLKRQ